MKISHPTILFFYALFPFKLSEILVGICLAISLSMYYLNAIQSKSSKTLLRVTAV